MANINTDMIHNRKYLDTCVHILIRLALILRVSHGDTTMETQHNTNNLTEHSVINNWTKLEEFHYTSPGCLELLSCNSSEPFPQRRCHCDSLCNVMKDCCPDAEQDYFPTSYDIQNSSQYRCTSVSLYDKNTAVLLVAKCAPSWTNETIRSLCEGINDNNDFLNDIPVTVMSDRPVTYKNKYCAYCNQQESFVSWNALLNCNFAVVDFSDCVTTLNAPKEVEYRICLTEVVSTCSPEHMTNSLVHECLFGNYSHVLLTNATRPTYFRNPQCALCNGIRLEDVICVEENTDSDTNPEFSFRCLVDINKASVSCNNVVQQINCKDTEIYDVISNTCRDILPLFGVECVHGVCRTIQKQNFSVSWLPFEVDVDENCTWSKLKPDEFYFTDNETLVEKATGIEYNKLYFDFIIHGNNVFVCVNNSELCFKNCGVNKKDYEGILSIIGLSISIFSLATTMIIYISLNKQRNNPGKNSLCLMTTLMTGQLSFLISPYLRPFEVGCQMIAVVTHLSFLSAFCWTNVMGFDFLKTFSSPTRVSVTSPTNIVCYAIYGFGVPALIVSIAVIVQYGISSPVTDSFKPNYGQVICWINSKLGLTVFFFSPVACAIVFDVFAFVITSVYIARANRVGAAATNRRKRCTTIINLKLAFIMGIPWVLALVANMTSNPSAADILWLLFIVFNTLQGLFIATSFLCTRKMLRLVKEGFETKFTINQSTTQT